MSKSLGSLLSGLGGGAGIAADKAGINPGQAMFGMTGALGGDGDGGGFFKKFAGNLQEMLFQRAMSGFLGGMGG